MNIQDLIGGGIGSQATDGISQKLGIDKDKTKWLLAAATPLMVSALSYNANKKGEADQIDNVLSSRHDGGIFDQLGKHFEQGPTDEENRIVNHIFGKNTNQVTESLALKSGLSADKVASVLAMLAPIVMGFLGKEKKSQSNSGGIGDLLGGLLGGSSSGSALGGGLGGLIGSVLGGGGTSTQKAPNPAGAIGDLVGDFFKKGNSKDAQGNVLDVLAGMFGK